MTSEVVVEPASAHRPAAATILLRRRGRRRGRCRTAARPAPAAARPPPRRAPTSTISLSGSDGRLGLGLRLRLGLGPRFGLRAPAPDAGPARTSWLRATKSFRSASAPSLSSRARLAEQFEALVDGEQEHGAGPLGPALRRASAEAPGRARGSAQRGAVAGLVRLGAGVLQRIERGPQLAGGEPLLREGERILHAGIFAVRARAAPRKQHVAPLAVELRRSARACPRRGSRRRSGARRSPRSPGTPPSGSSRSRAASASATSRSSSARPTPRPCASGATYTGSPRRPRSSTAPRPATAPPSPTTRPSCSATSAVIECERVPRLPGRHLGLEGRVAGGDPGRVDRRDRLPSPRARSSADQAVEVQRELRRVRAQPHRVDLVLPLVRDPGPDQALVEDAVPREELVVALQRVERLRERARHLRDAAVVLEEVEVARARPGRGPSRSRRGRPSASPRTRGTGSPRRRGSGTRSASPSASRSTSGCGCTRSGCAASTRG